MEKLERGFYIRDVNVVARELLGKILVHKTSDGVTSGLIVETEAYKGPEDKASHTYNNKRTSRTEVQFKDGGYAYIYMIYGMYYCFNVTANLAAKPEAVLIRALDPLEGIELMMKRRKINNKVNLCNGPGKLCSALGITREDYGEDLCGGRLYILESEQTVFNIKASTRINIDYAEEYKDCLWRYFIEGNSYVSRIK